jgi:hypothetical protein
MIKEFMIASALVLITSCGSSEAQMFTMTEARQWVDDHPNKRFLTYEEVKASGTTIPMWCYTKGVLNGTGGAYIGADKDGLFNSVVGMEYPLAVYDKVSCGAQAVSSEIPASFGLATTIKEPVPETIKEPDRTKLPAGGSEPSGAVVAPGSTTIFAD